MGHLPNAQTIRECFDLNESFFGELNLSVDDRLLYFLSKDLVVNKLLKMLNRNLDEINRLKKTEFVVEWVPVSTVAKIKSLTPDAVRKQLQNGSFEEGLHFKYIGSRIYLHQGAVEQIQRRRSLNG